MFLPRGERYNGRLTLCTSKYHLTTSTLNLACKDIEPEKDSFLLYQTRPLDALRPFVQQFLLRPMIWQMTTLSFACARTFDNTPNFACVVTQILVSDTASIERVELPFQCSIVRVPSCKTFAVLTDLEAFVEPSQ
jgi:hypothetical protein